MAFKLESLDNVPEGSIPVGKPRIIPAVFMGTGESNSRKFFPETKALVRFSQGANAYTVGDIRCIDPKGGLHYEIAVQYYRVSVKSEASSAHLPICLNSHIT